VLLPKGKEKDAGQRQEVKVNLLYILTQLVWGLNTKIIVHINSTAKNKKTQWH
jgi:hypothetical protein